MPRLALPSAEPCRVRRAGAAALGALALGLWTGSASPAAASPPAVVTAPAIAGARLAPVAYGALQGWGQDDAAAAFATFLESCAALGRAMPEAGPRSAPTLKAGLAHACAAARRLGPGRPLSPLARLFFEANFRPFRVIPDGRDEGFYTGYYEVEAEGAPAPTDAFSVPVYARPNDLVMESPTANSGPVGRRVDGKLVPYFDRAAIEDGALAGQGLEIVFLKDPVDLFFMQIQGSGRVRLPDGRVLKLNYDGYNGHRYLPVGRLLIERGIVPRDEMSMDRIRAVMEADPEAGRALRRENPSYVFFKALDLPPDAGAMGAQGVPLTAGRSIAVDRRLHSYGSPVFVEAELPLSAPGTAEPFRHLMIAQDTGSAIVGPARADIYFGAGREAGSRAGRIRHPGGFTLLVPRLAAPAAADARR
ncbi:murein transglycosylase A [Xanthobacter pseudotagetidis]|uniref:murein transglycosylase A n=1 Tax=Xanthobacter pseudotagetidis TaxID=3119911 RepID=UPI00372A6D3C